MRNTEGAIYANCGSVASGIASGVLVFTNCPDN
jgi:hypothetical protein